MISQDIPQYVWDCSPQPPPVAQFHAPPSSSSPHRASLGRTGQHILGACIHDCNLIGFLGIHRLKDISDGYDPAYVIFLIHNAESLTPGYGAVSRTDSTGNLINAHLLGTGKNRSIHHLPYGVIFISRSVSYPLCEMFTPRLASFSVMMEFCIHALLTASAMEQTIIHGYTPLKSTTAASQQAPFQATALQ